MDAKASSELYQIKQELRSIISDLENISSGVNRDFVGIGSNQCASSINSVINNYRRVQRELNNMDTSTVTDSHARSSGGGGGGSFGGGRGGGGFR